MAGKKNKPSGEGIVLEDISMIYQLTNGEEIHALSDISLTIKPGEMVAVLGPSGCGKTTLLNILGGFLAPNKGTLTLNGKPITGPDSDRGVVFQQGALFEWMNVEQNIGFGPKLLKKDPAESKAKVDEIINVVGLQGFAKKPVYQLSGGMQQRVSLARCLVNEPDVILMDEPLGALDALTREKMQDLILKLWDETGKSVMLITHSVEEALYLGERVIVMAPRPGRILEDMSLPFAKQGLKKDARDVKSSAEFVKVREKILSMIWKMESEIMGTGE